MGHSLNSPFFTSFSRSLEPIVLIAAISGTSMLRDFQRDTLQLIFTKPITRFAYLGAAGQDRL